MNKHRKYVSLVGLLAILLMPGVSQAQIVEAGAKTGETVGRMLSKPGKIESVYALEQSLNAALQRAALAPTVSAVQYTFDGSYPNLNNPSDVKELKHMLAKWQLDSGHHAEEDFEPFKYKRQLAQRYRNLDLSKISIEDIAQAAAHAENYRWTIFALNHGVHPRFVFREAAVNTLYINGHPMSRNFTERLISHYGVNPNAERPGEPGVLRDIITNSKGRFPYWFLDLPDVNPNVLVNNEPLIFYTPNLYNGEDAFISLANHIDLHITNRLNQTPVHTGARYFSLPRIWKDIPQELINKPDNLGNTPAHAAAIGRNAETGPNYANFHWLAEHGADLTIRNHNNQTPIDVLNESIRNAAHAGK